MSRPRFVVLLVDALGWELAARRRGFLAALPHRRPVETVLGFSSGALPTLFTGRLPSEHGHFLMYRRARGGGVFRGFTALRLLPGRLRRSYRFGRLLHAWLRASGVQGYFELYRVPRELLPEFDLCQRRDIFRPGAFAVESWWDTLRRSGVTFRVWDWRRPEPDNFRALLTDARSEGGAEVLVCYTAELDADLHREGSEGAAVARRLEGYEALVRELAGQVARHWIYVVSDHGMVDVTRTVDVMGALGGLEVRWPRDYLSFFDSTFARFWWRSAGARDAVRAALEALGGGRWLDDAELAREGALFPAREYGEDLFLLDPGVLMVPSFMGEEPLKGMHGYHPSHPQMRALLCSNRPLPQDLVRLGQVRAFLESEVRAFRSAA